MNDEGHSRRVTLLCALRIDHRGRCMGRLVSGGQTFTWCRHGKPPETHCPKCDEPVNVRKRRKPRGPKEQPQ
jgi:hypothetical protein